MVFLYLLAVFFRCDSYNQYTKYTKFLNQVRSSYCKSAVKQMYLLVTSGLIT